MTITAKQATEEAADAGRGWLMANAGGEEQVAEGHQPFLISGRSRAWLVISGHIDLFAIGVQDGDVTGMREFFMSLEEGDLILSVDIERYGLDHGFLAVGSTGTRVLAFDWEPVFSAAAAAGQAGVVGVLVDQWIAGVSEACVRNIPVRPKPDLLVLPGEELPLGQRGITSTKKAVAWVEARSSELMFLSTEELFFREEQASFPVAPGSWLESFEARTYTTQTTATLMEAGSFTSGLDNFHLAVCNNEFINKQLVAVDEFNRLKTKAEYQQAAREGALAEIASVLNPEYANYTDARPSGDGDSLLAAARLVGKSLGIEVKAHPGAGRGEVQDFRLNAIAKVSRFRVREIALRDDWWNHDHGPFIAFTEEDSEPVALIPKGPRSYEAIFGSTGQKVKVDEAFSKTLHPLGRSFYRPFPDGLLNGWNLIKFGTRGLRPEFITIALMGVGLGLLGLVTPFFTRQIFDNVIPGAERGQLFQMVGGMVAAAIGVIAFEVTRAIAVLRIEGKMDYSVQAAMWDRLLSLPLNFFRNFSAGDLANRAYGIDKVRELISGVGVTAVLGATTALFYLFLLFKYSFPLAAVGIGLVVLAMVYTAATNLWQLSHQRRLYGVIGKITSTVLQFISGVAKIRVAGAEDHAFKVWARQFSEQRRISFTVGRITNAVQVFTAAFPVTASLALFAMLVMLQGDATAAGEEPPISTGEFIAFNAAFGTFLSSMLQLSTASLQIFQTMPVYERFKPVIQTEPEIDEAKSYPGELNGEIEIYHCNFRYQEDGPLILKNVSINIKPGEFVAFVGPSGSGKSTLLRLLLGFEIPESGKIYFDGQDLSSLDIREVRQQIGVVLQTSRLMPTDIFRNIVGNTSMTKDDAWEAAEKAGLAEDVRKMPMQMHTVVSEGGGGFSGGQKQRLMIARAIVHRPRILFLDEATSALDNRSQAVVTRSMDQLQATRIVVAHRLSTIMNADTIYVLVDGRVAEKGSYQELMELDGHFAELAKRQIA